jgi:hypothetical protein
VFLDRCRRLSSGSVWFNSTQPVLFGPDLLPVCFEKHKTQAYALWVWWTWRQEAQKIYGTRASGIHLALRSNLLVILESRDLFACELSAWAGLECNLPNLSFLSSWDSRCRPAVPGLSF